MSEAKQSEANQYTGGCFCGDVQFNITGQLSDATHCHCSMCRKRFGGAGSLFSGIGDSEFTWTTGQEKLTRYGEDYGLGFCQKCGSTLVGFKGEDILGVTLSCLNGDPKVKISKHIFVGSKASWDEIGGDAPQSHEWPP